MRVHVLRAPCTVGPKADDVTVDDVADSTEGLAKRRKYSPCVQHSPDREASPPALVHDHKTGADDRPEEGHSALPRCDDPERMAEKVTKVRLNHVVQTAADETGNNYREEYSQRGVAIDPAFS